MLICWVTIFLSRSKSVNKRKYKKIIVNIKNTTPTSTLRIDSIAFTCLLSNHFNTGESNIKGRYAFL